MKKIFLVIILPLVGLSLVFGQVKVQKYDALYFEKDEVVLYFYPSEIEQSEIFEMDLLYGSIYIDEIKFQEVDAILHLDSIATSDTSNVCYVRKMEIHTNDTILPVKPKDWIDWLAKVSEREDLDRIGPFFFEKDYKKGGDIYFFDIPQKHNLRPDYYGRLGCYMADFKVDVGLGLTLKKDDPSVYVNKKLVYSIEVDFDFIDNRKDWFKEIRKIKWEK